MFGMGTKSKVKGQNEGCNTKLVAKGKVPIVENPKKEGGTNSPPKVLKSYSRLLQSDKAATQVKTYIAKGHNQLFNNYCLKARLNRQKLVETLVFIIKRAEGRGKLSTVRSLRFIKADCSE
jgi:hypothetical protein